MEQGNKDSWSARSRSRTYATEFIMNTLTNKYAEEKKGFHMNGLRVYNEKVNDIFVNDIFVHIYFNTINSL